MRDEQGSVTAEFAAALPAVVLLLGLLLLLFFLFGGGFNQAADKVGVDVKVETPDVNMPNVEVPDNVKIELPEEVKVESSGNSAN